MVLWYRNGHQYTYDFSTVSLAYLNRYPNPYSAHVLSCDTIDQHIDDEGNLHITKLVMKTGRLPVFIKPLLGNNLNSWIIEKIVVNPLKQTMDTYTANLDHTRFIRVEEFNYFRHSNDKTIVKSRVKFSSGFSSRWWPGFKDRIENWSHNKFISNIKKSRDGLDYVMKGLQPRVFGKIAAV